MAKLTMPDGFPDSPILLAVAMHDGFADSPILLPAPHGCDGCGLGVRTLARSWLLIQQSLVLQRWRRTGRSLCQLIKTFEASCYSSPPHSPSLSFFHRCHSYEGLA